MSKIEVVLKADAALLNALTTIAEAISGGKASPGAAAADDGLGGEDDDLSGEGEEDFFADTPAPPAKPAKPAKPVKEEKGPQKITVEMMRELGAILVADAKKSAKFKALLGKVGAVNLGKVPEAKRAAFYSAMQKI